MITEALLIEHCSLTLSSLKSASLFTVKFSEFHSLKHDITLWNHRFLSKGIKLRLLKAGSSSALIYVYREDMLKKDFSDPSTQGILSRYSYSDLDIETALNRLSKRLYLYEEFPHEIGLFLGYPPKDVDGFICNEGKNCQLCRYWKVYGDKDEALQKFAKYDKCNEIYKRLWQDGRDIMQLTVKKMSVA